MLLGESPVAFGVGRPLGQRAVQVPDWTLAHLIIGGGFGAPTRVERESSILRWGLAFPNSHPRYRVVEALGL